MIPLYNGYLEFGDPPHKRVILEFSDPPTDLLVPPPVVTGHSLIIGQNKGAIIYYREGGPSVVVGGPNFFGVVKGGDQNFFSGSKGGTRIF